MPLNAIVKVVTMTLSGTSTNVWKYVNWPAEKQAATLHSDDGESSNPMMSSSGAGPQNRSTAGGMVAKSYSPTAPWLGAGVGNTTSPSPRFICHGVRDSADCLTP